MTMPVEPSREPPDGGMPVGVEGFSAFYRETLPKLYGYFVTRCGGNVAVAEDLTQETYLAFVRDVRAEREIASASAWLFGIARHKLVDHYRRQSRLEAIGTPWEPDAAGDLPAPGPDAGAEASHERVMDALAHLPESQRIVVGLRYLDGRAMDEIAADLGKSIHAVESLLARARLNLKRHLIADHPEEERPR